MRPQYETEADRVNERRILDAAFPARIAHKLPKRYHIDYLLNETYYDTGNVRDRAILVECKARTCPWGTYDSYMISLTKVDAGRRLAKIMDGFFAIATGWSDNKVAVVYIPVDLPPQYQRKFVMGGRSDRNDPEDREPVMLIPNAAFKVIDIPDTR